MGVLREGLEDSFRVELRCTDSVNLNSYKFVYGPGGQLLDLTVTPLVGGGLVELSSE